MDLEHPNFVGHAHTTQGLAHNIGHSHKDPIGQCKMIVVHVVRNFDVLVVQGHLLHIFVVANLVLIVVVAYLIANLDQVVHHLARFVANCLGGS